LRGLIGAESVAEQFAHGAAFAFGDGFGAFREIGREADGEDLRFARLGDVFLGGFVDDLAGMQAILQA